MTALLIVLSCLIVVYFVGFCVYFRKLTDMGPTHTVVDIFIALIALMGATWWPLLFLQDVRDWLKGKL